MTSSPRSDPESSAARRPPGHDGDAAWLWPIVGGLLLAGLVIRLYVTLLPPADAYRWDHHEYLSWGRLMDQDGFAALYDRVPPPGRMWNPREQAFAVARHLKPRLCNYPPGIAYALYPKIRLLTRMDPTQASNTPVARLIFSGLPMLCDLALAFGCLALVRPFGARAAVVAFAAAILAPPIIHDTCTWGQTDTMVLAPAVWLIWAMQQNRWLTAGVLWGAALAVKTQGVLLAPVWLVALVLVP